MRPTDSCPTDPVHQLVLYEHSKVLKYMRPALSRPIITLSWALSSNRQGAINQCSLCNSLHIACFSFLILLSNSSPVMVLSSAQLFHSSNGFTQLSTPSMFTTNSENCLSLSSVVHHRRLLDSTDVPSACSAGSMVRRIPTLLTCNVVAVLKAEPGFVPTSTQFFAGGTFLILLGSCSLPIRPIICCRTVTLCFNLHWNCHISRIVQLDLLSHLRRTPLLQRSELSSSEVWIQISLCDYPSEPPIP